MSDFEKSRKSEHAKKNILRSRGFNPKLVFFDEIRFLYDIRSN